MRRRRERRKIFGLYWERSGSRGGRMRRGWPMRFMDDSAAEGEGSHSGSDDLFGDEFEEGSQTPSGQRIGGISC